MEQKKEGQQKPLIIYEDDDGTVRTTYSFYELNNSTITFLTNQNKITIPISRLIKIKEEKDGEQ